MIDTANLPKSMQRRPEIRALTLRVYQVGPRCYKVPGRERIYSVSVTEYSTHCNCAAAASGHTCAHAIAVKRYILHKENQHVSHHS